MLRANSIDFNCTTKELAGVLISKCYECIVSHIISETPNTTVGSVTTMLNLTIYKAVAISVSPRLIYIPTGIATFFTNLEGLLVCNTSLKSISKDDLEPFDHLRVLCFDFNQLTSLDGDVFTHQKYLEVLSLSNNHIKQVSLDTFKPLSVLTQLMFMNNTCFNFTAQFGRKIVEKTIAQVIKNCTIEEEWLFSCDL